MNAFHLRMDRDFLAVKILFAIIIFFLFISQVEADSREYIIRDIGEPCGVPAGIALDVAARRVYWADRFKQSIRSANVDLQDVHDVVVGLGEPQRVAIFDTVGRKCSP